MSYLLDVNALIAWRHARSPHHQRFHAWAGRVGRTHLRTCALAELGFMRVSMHVFGYTLAQAQTAVDTLRREAGGFVETAPIPRLAAWATSPARTSDAYLVQVAAAHGLKLATFDERIRDSSAELIV
jgi:predicted nucleic acid-binding protein